MPTGIPFPAIGAVEVAGIGVSQAQCALAIAPREELGVRDEPLASSREELRLEAIVTDNISKVHRLRDVDGWEGLSAPSTDGSGEGREVGTSVLADHALGVELHRPHGLRAVAHRHQHTAFTRIGAVSRRDEASREARFVDRPAVVAPDETSRGDSADEAIRRIYYDKCGGMPVARCRELHQRGAVVLGESLMPEADTQDRLYSRFGTDESLHTGKLTRNAWPRRENESIMLGKRRELELTLWDNLEGELGEGAQELHDIIDEGVAVVND